MGVSPSCCAARKEGGLEADQEFILAQFLAWLTPIDLEIGVVRLSLQEARLPESSEKALPFTINSEKFSLHELSLFGIASVRIPLAGVIERKVEVLVDIDKQVDSNMATVNVKDMSVEDKGAHLTERFLQVENIKERVRCRLKDTIDAHIAGRAHQDSEPETATPLALADAQDNGGDAAPAAETQVVRA